MRILLLSAVSCNLCAFTFQNAVQLLEQHNTTAALQSAAAAAQHTGVKASAWFEPQLKFSAKNISQALLNNKTNAMSGVEFSIAQTIPLTASKSHLQASFNAQRLNLLQQAAQQQRFLLQKLWQILIAERKLHTELQILQESRVWIGKTLSVAEKLYTNGKTTRRAILDIQIRAAELDTELSNTKHELGEQWAKLVYLLGNTERIESTSIPWQLLQHEEKTTQDYQAQALQYNLYAKRHQAKAQLLAQFPDIMLGFTYNPGFGGQDHSFSLQFSLPLPITASRRAEYARSLQAQQQAELQLAEYRNFKDSELQALQQRVAKIKAALRILQTGIKQYATDSRSLAFTYYRLGNTTYAELLQAELKLQEILLKQADLMAQLANTRLQYRFLKGVKLHDE